MRGPALVLPSLLFLVASGCGSGSAEGLVGNFGMGEAAQVGNLTYTVSETQWSLSLGDGAVARIPVNRFLLVKLTVLNSGVADASSVPSFSLVDDSGRSYQEANGGEGVPDWMGFARRVNPTQSKPGAILFDVPQKRYRLRVADESDQKFAYIALPLTLGDSPANVVPDVKR